MAYTPERGDIAGRAAPDDDQIELARFRGHDEPPGMNSDYWQGGALHWRQNPTPHTKRRR